MASVRHGSAEGWGQGWGTCAAGMGQRYGRDGAHVRQGWDTCAAGMGYPREHGTRSAGFPALTRAFGAAPPSTSHPSLTPSLTPSSPPTHRQHLSNPLSSANASVCVCVSHLGMCSHIKTCACLGPIPCMRCGP